MGNVKKFKLKRAVSCLAVASLLGTNVPSITSLAGVYEPWTTTIQVDGIYVDEQNHEDVLGEKDGDKATVTYDRETKTLKLDGANIVCEANNPIYCEEENIIIETVSDSTLKVSDDYMIIANGFSNGTVTFKGEGKLTLEMNPVNGEYLMSSDNIINEGNIELISEKSQDCSNIVNAINFENKGDCKISVAESFSALNLCTFKQTSGTLDISGEYAWPIYTVYFEQSGGKTIINNTVKNDALEVVDSYLSIYSGIYIDCDYTEEIKEQGFIYSGGELDIELKNTVEEDVLSAAGIYCYDVPCNISGGKLNINISSQRLAAGIANSMDKKDYPISITGGDVNCSVVSATTADPKGNPVLVTMASSSSSGFEAPVFDNVLVDVSKNADGSETTSYKGEDFINVYRYMHSYERPVIKVEGKKATCTTDGVKDYYKYDDALGKAYFLDEDAKNVIEDIEKWLTSDGLIKATGHSYKNGVCEYCNEKDPSVKPDPEKPDPEKPDPEKPDPDKKTVKVGDKLKDKAKSTYVVTNVKKKEVAFSKPANKKVKSVNVPATIKVDGVSYKVVKVADKAFAGCKKLTKVTIGKNVIKIGANAFAGCKKLKTLTIKNTKLKAKNLNKKAFGGLTKITTIKVAKAKVKSYKKMFKKKGLSNKVAVKAY